MGLYFGYGSNLDASDWSRFCDENALSARLHPIRAAWLPDHELAFNYRSERRGGGALNLRARIGSLASGYLFEVDDEGWSALDRKEGVPRFYRRRACVVLDQSGAEHTASTYEVVPERWTEFTAPSAAYLEICRRGRLAHMTTLDDLIAVAEGRPAAPCIGLFVYGTLMQGEQRASRLRGVTLGDARAARTGGRLLDLGDYPGFVPGDEGWVTGEYVEATDIASLLPVLDKVELFHGYGRTDNLYRRSVVTVHLDGGRSERAWTYVTMRPDAPVIASGSWRAHRRVTDR